MDTENTNEAAGAGTQTGTAQETQTQAWQVQSNSANPSGTAGTGQAAVQTDAAKTGAMEVLDFANIKMPEGLGDLGDDFKSVAKDIGLSTEGAQKLVNYYSDKVVKPMQAAQEQARNELISGWQKEAQTEFDAAGLEMAKKAYGAFADDDLKNLFEQTGLGNHPAVIRMFNALGKRISEGSLVIGQGQNVKPAEERLFGKSIQSVQK